MLQSPARSRYGTCTASMFLVGGPLVPRVSALQEMNLLPWQKTEAILAIVSRNCGGLDSSSPSCEADDMQECFCILTNQQE